MQALKRVIRDYRLVQPRERSKLEGGVGIVQYTIVLRRTHTALAGYELDSMDGRAGMVTCELVRVEHKRSGRGQFPHQIATALRGLRKGLSAERRVQNFFRALAQLKGCKVVELQAEPLPVEEKITKEVEVEQATSPAVAQPLELEKPSEEEVPECWEDSV